VSRLPAIGCLLLLAACRSPEQSQAPLKLAHLPPTPKDIIDATFALSARPLSDATCKGSGTEQSDSTIGRYLAGYLAELSSQDSRNAVTTSVERATEDGEAVYHCRVMIRHAQGEDVWSWGIEFTARQSDGVVKQSPVRCIGAG
jgi:hypothetical protein